jgi:hypothetical protein
MDSNGNNILDRNGNPLQYHNDFPSDEDLWLLNLVDQVWVVPYKWCSEEGVLSIIAAKPKSTWYFPGHEPSSGK